MTEWIIGAVGTIAALIAVWFAGKVEGRKTARLEREIDELNSYIATGEELDDVFRKVDGISDDELARLLRERAKRKP